MSVVILALLPALNQVRYHYYLEDQINIKPDHLSKSYPKFKQLIQFHASLNYSENIELGRLDILGNYYEHEAPTRAVKVYLECLRSPELEYEAVILTLYSAK